MKLDEKFNIKIIYITSGESEVIVVETKDIEWSMNQFQRNRPPLKWTIID